MPSVKVRSAGEAPRFAAERKVVKSSNGSDFSSSSAWEESAGRERPGWRILVWNRDDTGFEKLEDDGLTRAGCREPETALSLARRAEGPSESESPVGAGAREFNSSEDALKAVMEVTSSEMLQKDVTAKRNQYARTGFPKYVAVYPKGALLCEL